MSDMAQTRHRVLVVDDDPGFRKLLETILTGEGHDVRTAGNVAEARRRAAEGRYTLVLSDLKLPDGSGLDVLRWFNEKAPGTPMVMITGFGTVPTAVEAMKLGAIDYLEKPLRSPDELRQLVERAVSERDWTECPTDEGAVAVPITPQAGAGFSCEAMVVRDPRMRELLELVRKVAPTHATVLITGESGTGKEVLARCIHRNSRRAGQVFLALNCAALSPTLIESELFGHERGAFTGAVVQHQGVFERAGGGTLFLDEIGELDGNLQSKLLRVLQERTFERVGGSKTLTTDVRLIAATNRDIRKMVSEGRFRDDLYYRLSIFPLAIPPLRERPADIPVLARLFLARASDKLGQPVPEITDGALQALSARTWPGNVRELENVMERLAILSEERIDVEDAMFGEEEGKRPVSMKEIEKQSIIRALRANEGNRTRAARQLGISLRTLQYRLKEYGINE